MLHRILNWLLPPRETRPKKPVSYEPAAVTMRWDQACAEAAIALKIPYVAFMPFPKFGEQWPSAVQERLKRYLEKAAEVRYTDPAGKRSVEWGLFTRNCDMVDWADEVLALWSGERSGTGNCVAYAWQVGKPVTNVWGEWVRVRGPA